jgi:DNA-3-methyladenine glycosylase
MGRNNRVLPVSFYERDVLLVAPQLLGKKLIRTIGNQRISGIITETEAYRGEEDLACHAHVGKTARNSVMYSSAGIAYVYFTYGMHWLLNCVTGSVGFPAAVLIRSVQPLEGLSLIAQNRKHRTETEWCNGPAKICQAFSIDGQQNGFHLCTPTSGLWIEEGTDIDPSSIATSPRIGMGTVPEPWFSKPWRFFIHISKP